MAINDSTKNSQPDGLNRRSFLAGAGVAAAAALSAGLSAGVPAALMVTTKK